MSMPPPVLQHSPLHQHTRSPHKHGDVHWHSTPQSVVIGVALHFSYLGSVLPRRPVALALPVHSWCGAGMC